MQWQRDACARHVVLFAGVQTRRAGDGAQTLAQATGGKERLELSGVWKDLPRRIRQIELTPCLLLLEVLERQIGLVTQRAWPVLARLRLPAWQRQPRVAAPQVTKQPPPAEPVATSTVRPPIEEPAAPVEPAALTDALARARQRAQEKTRR